MTVRVLIADDQQLVRAGFRLILERQPGVEVVGEATNGAEAVALAERLCPDVVLMDIRMPDLDGIQATRLILANPAAAGVRVVILTTFDLDEYVYDALKAGANGFLLKDLPPEQLAAAVLTVSQGDALLSPSVTRRLIESFTAANRPAGRPPAVLDQLTPREMEVLRLGRRRRQEEIEIWDVHQRGCTGTCRTAGGHRAATRLTFPCHDRGSLAGETRWPRPGTISCPPSPSTGRRSGSRSWLPGGGRRSGMSRPTTST